MRGVGHPSRYWFLPAIAALLAILCTFEPILQRAELASVDYRFVQRGPRSTTAPIVMVEIDSDTEMAWRDKPIAFWGTELSDLLQKCLDAGAKCVVVDIIFPRSFDEYLQKLSPNAPAPTRDLLRTLSENRGRLFFPRYGDALPFEGTFEIPEFYEEAVAPYLGSVDLPPGSPDGVIRRMYLTQSDDRLAIRSLPAVVAAAAGAKLPAGQTEFNINFTGRNFPALSAIHLLNANSPPTRLNDSIVIVHATYSGSPDLHNTAYNPQTHGGTILANGIATLIDGRPMRELPLPVQLTLIGVVGLGAGLLTLYGRSRVVVTSLVGFSMVYWIIALAAFRADWLLPVVFVGLALILGGFFGTAGQVLWQLKARDEVERIMGVMVSDGVRKAVLNTGGALTSQRVEAAVMFLDIRGFTTWSEHQEPETVVETVNGLLKRLIPVVDESGGYINTFLGDGFLAVFGAPARLSNPCQSAYDAAERIIEICRDWPVRFSSDSTAQMVGIGIHYGPVTLGGLGTNERCQFTVVGNIVNTAQRLESKCKDLNCPMVLSEAVVSRLEKPHALAGPTVLSLRGLSGSVASYTYLPQGTMK